MTAANPFERLVEDWLASTAPVTIPPELHDSAIDAARQTPQRRPGLLSPAGGNLYRAAGLGVGLAAVMILAVGAANLLPGFSPSGPAASSSPTASPSSPEPTNARQTPDVDPRDGEYRIGRHGLTVDGFRVSFQIEASSWEPYRGFLIAKSNRGPQGAEGIIFWAGFPDGAEADPCAALAQDGSLAEPASPTANELAEAVAAAAGVEVLTGPVNLILGGRPATHLEVSILEDRGCDPGYFYNWKAQTGGAMWVNTGPGDVYKVWIVDVDGRLLFIGAATHADAGTRLAEEMDAIVNSIQFS